MASAYQWPLVDCEAVQSQEWGLVYVESAGRNSGIGSRMPHHELQHLNDWMTM